MPAAPWDEYDELSAHGIVAYRGGNFAAAIQNLETATTRYPNRFLAWYYLALAIRRTGNVQLAVEHLRRASSIEPYETYTLASQLYYAERNRVRDGAAYENGWLSFLDTGLMSGALRTATLEQLKTPTPDQISPIPKRILQYWDKKEPPADVQKAINGIREMNPDFEHVLLNDVSAREFIVTHYGADVAELYDLCPHVASKSDLARVLYLNIFGGYYIDADEIAQNSLSSILVAGNYNEIYSYTPDANSCINNWFIGTVPNTPILARNIKYMLGNIEVIKRRGIINYAWTLTGPGPITFAVLDLMSEPPTVERQQSPVANAVFIEEAVYRNLLTSGDFEYKSTKEGNWRLAN